jgi:hypothetical protein
VQTPYGKFLIEKSSFAETPSRTVLHKGDDDDMVLKKYLGALIRILALS